MRIRVSSAFHRLPDEIDVTGEGQQFGAALGVPHSDRTTVVGGENAGLIDIPQRLKNPARVAR